MSRLERLRVRAAPAVRGRQEVRELEAHAREEPAQPGEPARFGEQLGEVGGTARLAGRP